MNSAIVLGTEVNGMGVIRSLGRLGVECAAVCAPLHGDHALRSKYLAFSEQISPTADHDDITRVLSDVASRLKNEQPVLIPTTDMFSQYICDNQEQLAERFLFRCASKELFDSFLDKWKTDQICRANGIIVPNTFNPQDDAELLIVSEKLSFPAIVKPRYTFYNNFPGKNVVVNDANELLDFFAEHAVLGQSVIQEIIPSGDGDIIVVVTYSGKDGLVKATYSGRKIRQLLPDYGATCYGISESHPELVSTSENFLNKIGYKGFAALEYARSRADGQFYFLELNTRTYYHNQLFADAGVDLTQIGFAEITGLDQGASNTPKSQRNGLVWIDFRRDFKSVRIKLSHGNITVSEWLKSLLYPRSFAYWNWHDPMPFVEACTFGMKKNIPKVVRHLISFFPKRSSKSSPD